MTTQISNVEKEQPMRKVRPAVDIYEGPDAFRIVLEVPGVHKDDVQIDVENRQLSVSAKRKLRDDDALVYQRSFTIPTSVDTNATEATLNAGVLTLTLNKHKDAKPRQIKVKAA
jgi:HSP20 family protein